MLVSEECIIERMEPDEREVFHSSEGVQILFNTTEPSVIRDGVDGMAVSEVNDETYRIDFWGYAYGRLLITPDGVQEIGQKLTSDEASIPSWTLAPETVDPEDLPWWVPDSVEVDQTVTCEECGETVPVSDVFTPQRSPPSMDGPVICEACWEQR